MTLTMDPPSDVDVEESEYDTDDAVDGSDEVFKFQDPGRGLR